MSRSPSGWRCSRAARPRSSWAAAWAPSPCRAWRCCGRATTYWRANGSTPAWCVGRGMKPLGVRVTPQNPTALAVADWFTKQPQFVALHHPGLASHPDHGVAKRILDGLGGMVAVELKGGARAAERFLRALTIAAHAPSLGGVETLVSEPRLTSHAMLTPDARARAGIPDGFLRFSIGLEDADDLIADFAQALAQL